jgi:hypothetical protein
MKIQHIHTILLLSGTGPYYHLVTGSYYGEAVNNLILIILNVPLELHNFPQKRKI